VGKRPVLVSGLNLFPTASIEYTDPNLEFTLGATNLNLSMSMMGENIQSGFISFLIDPFQIQGKPT